MKRALILTAALATAAMFSAPVLHAQTDPCKTVVKHHKAKKSEPSCDDVRQQLKAQQQEIDDLKAKLAGTPAPQTMTETDPVATPIANSAAAAAADAANKADAAAAAARKDAADQAALAASVAATQKKLEDEIESPTALHYKGVLIQPGGFMAAESVFRTRTFNSNIATPFNSQPYGNSANYFISEFNGSAQQSRISMLVTAPFSWGKAGGYFETDFLGAGVTSNNNQTNSYVLRVRSAFGQVTLNSGFTFQAGQMFTLATEDKKGVLAGPGAEALPPTIDPNYHVGFDFGRQWGLRAAQSFAGGKFAAAVSVEGSQIILATTTNAPTNFFFGGAGSGGGLFNSTANYSDNLAPDLHLKVAADPGFGHFELGGIVRFFRDRVYPQATFGGATSTTGINYMTPGGGFYASARVPVQKFADVALKVTYGKGIARYEASNLGDVTVRPSGILEPLKTGDGLFELDLHPTKKLDIFFLAGAEYLQRTAYSSGTGLQVGYAGLTTQNDTGCTTQTAPTANSGYGFSGGGTCTGATRYLAEFTPGLTYRFFSSPTKGRFQFQLTYSYLDRQAWQGYSGAAYVANANFALPNGDGPQSAQGITNMFHTSFRYYIP